MMQPAVLFLPRSPAIFWSQAIWGILAQLFISLERSRMFTRIHITKELCSQFIKIGQNVIYLNRISDSCASKLCSPPMLEVWVTMPSTTGSQFIIKMIAYVCKIRKIQFDKISCSDNLSNLITLILNKFWSSGPDLNQLPMYIKEMSWRIKIADCNQSAQKLIF